MAGITWSLDLPLNSFLFHVALVFGVIYCATLASMLAAKLKPAALAKGGIYLVYTTLTLFLMFSYAIYYISCANWGMPMHITMAFSQIGQLPYIIETLPISSWVVWTFIFVPLATTGLVYALFMGKLEAEQESALDLRLTRGKGAISWSAILLPLFAVSALAVWPGIRQLRQDFPARKDPILALLLSGDIHGNAIQGLGYEHAEAKMSYPENIITEKPNVILIICDALRADHMSVYGYERPTSPFFDSLASLPGSFLHPRYFSISSFSFTGISASLSSREILTSNSFMVQEVLKKQDYYVDVSASGDFVNFYGLDRYISDGVDNFQDGYTYNKNPYHGHASTADDRILVVEKLKRAPDWNGDPFFKYLHFMSTHQLGKMENQWRIFLPDEVSLGQPTRETLVNNYDNRVFQFDNYLRQTFNILTEKGYLNNTLVLITSDHGQSLLEGKDYWHGNSVAVSETYIPLLIFGTGNVTLPSPSASTINDQTDLAPTITGLLGLPLPASWEGDNIFTDTVSGPVFQSESGEYAIISEHNDHLYQLRYRHKTRETILSNIDTPAEPLIIEPSDLPEPVVAQWLEDIIGHYGLENE